MKTYKIIEDINYSEFGEVKNKWDFELLGYEADREFIEEQALDIIKDDFNIYNPDETLINYIIEKEKLEEHSLENERDYLMEDFNEHHNFEEVYNACNLDKYNGWIDRIREYDNYLVLDCGAGNSGFTIILEIGEDDE